MNALAFNQDKAAATSEAIEWQLGAAVDPVPFDSNATYQPVMGVSIRRTLRDLSILIYVSCLRPRTIIFSS